MTKNANTVFLLSNIFSLFLLILSFQQAQSQCNLTDWTALKALYESTNGDNWANNKGWGAVKSNSPSTICNLENLYGVTLNANGRVDKLHFVENQLSGSIPPELGSLSSLTELCFWTNQLSGSIPPELGNLSNLTYLDLALNQLSGGIPRELGNLSNLTNLYLGENQLSGSVPFEFGNLVNLTDLILSNNQLSGSIPPELGNLNNLVELRLGWNQLSGSIPPELGNLSNLIQLSFWINQLSGNIPPEFGNLSNLTDLSLGENQLSGSIPPELSNLSNLTILNLGENQLSGSIPPELGNLSVLRNLFLRENQLSGIIPTELGNLSNLRYLSLNGNQLSGIIPTELGNLSKLLGLRLQNNQLTGSIPAELGNFSKLDYLVLANNQLTGNIPAELGNLSNLLSLTLNSNQLTGNIPLELGNLAKLEKLNLYSNQLNGELPPELGNLSKLTLLTINDNNLSGCYPDNFINYCTQINQFYGNQSISNDNNFDATWRYFCIASTCKESKNGCTNPAACNYSDLATEDDGSCILPLDNCTFGSSVINAETLNEKDGFSLDAFMTKAGDINNDGFDDIFIRNVVDNNFKHYLVYGKADIGDEIDLNLIDGNNGFEIEGIEFSFTELTPAGDVNNDGFNDVVIWGADKNNYNTIFSYVIYGGENISNPLNLGALDDDNGFAIESTYLLDAFSYYTNAAGDLNNDGFDDIIISSFEGSSFVIYGSDDLDNSFDLNDLNGSNGFSIGTGEKSYEYGYSATGAGDVNNDGFDDLVIGKVDENTGVSYIIYGGINVSSLINLDYISNDIGIVVKGLEFYDSPIFTVSTDGAGDFNNDGIADVIMAETYSSIIEEDEALVYVLYGGNNFSNSFGVNSLDGSNGFTITGISSYPSVLVSEAGDVNNDGFDDIIIKADNPAASFLIYGRDTMDSALNLNNLNSEDGFFIGEFGNVDPVGDINNDGFDDLIVDMSVIFGACNKTYGCTDFTACNFAAAATCDDGSCTYPASNFDCEGNCLDIVDCDGGNPPIDKCNLTDWQALKALYQNTNGDNWFRNQGWEQVNDSMPPTNCDLSNLYGVKTNENGRVTQINLYNNDLSGKLPQEIGNLSELTNLSLSSADLEGGIPVEIGDLTKLKYLYLVSSNITGTIPPELGKLANLRDLRLSYNQLSGSIPIELSKLMNLNYLSLDYNQLTGTIPPELANLNRMRWLSMSNNQLTGNLPAELSSLIYLQLLAVDNNNLSGCYASEINTLCDQLTDNFFDEADDISSGNNFDATWSNFCSASMGDCNNLRFGDLNNFYLFPNPTSDNVFVQFESASEQPKYISIFDVSGKRYLSKPAKISGKNIELKVQHFPKGIYMVEVSNGYTSSHIQKLIVQ